MLTTSNQPKRSFLRSMSQVKYLGSNAEMLGSFIDELRRSGLPISASEYAEALTALELVGYESAEVFRESLKLVLVKKISHLQTFEKVFQRFFAFHLDSSEKQADGFSDVSGVLSASGSGSEASEVDLESLVQHALEAGVDRDISLAASTAVTWYAGIDPSRSVGAAYYIQKTLSSLSVASQIEDLSEGLDVFEIHNLKNNAKKLESKVAADVRRRLLMLRGVEAIREPSTNTPDNVAFLYATAADLQQMRKLLRPLAAKLAVKLGRRRRQQQKRTLDVRATIHQSLRTGGVPVKLRHKPRLKHKPELIVLADLSGSVASFARFTLNLLHVMQGQFSTLRSFAFVDEMDEITESLKRDDFSSAMNQVVGNAKLLGAHGHSDYGSAFKLFEARFLESLKASSTVLILGDARNNYHHPEAESLKQLAGKVKSVYWLNPEPTSYWDTGDSVMADYIPYLTGAVEVRTLKQLERFIDHNL